MTTPFRTGTESKQRVSSPDYTLQNRKWKQAESFLPWLHHPFRTGIESKQRVSSPDYTLQNRNWKQAESFSPLAFTACLNYNLPSRSTQWTQTGKNSSSFRHLLWKKKTQNPIIPLIPTHQYPISVEEESKETSEQLSKSG